VAVNNDITLDELAKRVDRAALGMGKRNPHRILLLNTAAALRALGIRLEKALEENSELKAESSRIITPVGGHRVN
jgi:hypothetical protein